MSESHFPPQHQAQQPGDEHAILMASPPSPPSPPSAVRIVVSSTSRPRLGVTVESRHSDEERRSPRDAGATVRPPSSLAAACDAARASHGSSV